jgi:hypothetical protein
MFDSDVYNFFKKIWTHNEYVIRQRIDKGDDYIIIMLSYGSEYGAYIQELMEIILEEKKLTVVERNEKKEDILFRVDKIVSSLAKMDSDKWIEDHEGWWYMELKCSDASVMEYGNIFRHIESLEIDYRGAIND